MHDFMTVKQKRIFRISILVAMTLLITAASFWTYGTISNAAAIDAGTNNSTAARENERTEADIDELNVTRGDHELDLTTRASSDGTSLSLTYNSEATTLSAPLRILLLLTVISLAPSILVMLTSFTRIIVVLHFARTAIGTQTSPPNQVLIGLALFLTFFIMNPIFVRINNEAIKPLDAGEITQEQALEIGMEPIREFMFSQVLVKDINLFTEISGEIYETTEDIPNYVLIPAFILSELRQAFIIGFCIYIPFIVIDMVVSSVLMSMGMMMLPPTTISLPFKVLLFILADGWELIIGNLVKTFY